jgi:hypothetical protein
MGKGRGRCKGIGSEWSDACMCVERFVIACC